ncbi:MAG: anhydro-N-acetylmuramic acid kinase [Gemmatimonadota bacterium]|jgi:anhydro-N-acetylmuramic acid kinase
MRVIGLMSGTSLDGIDAALVRFDGGPADLDWRIEAFVTRPYAESHRAGIQAVIDGGSAAAICRLHARLGEWFAEAALDVCEAAAIEPAGIDLIGSHGQTVWHDPPTAGRRGATLQLGCAATIAERTGIDVISDFRSRDVAAGGHGAPLVPWVDGLLFSVPDRSRILVNIGGMANLTRVGPRGSADALLAFDTGPGNALIDAAVGLASGGTETFDRDGARAAAGRVHPEWLAELRAHPFFDSPPPRSTGRETFGHMLVESLVDRWAVTGERWNDVVATLTALTATTIADAVNRWAAPAGADEVIVTGGGAHNPALLGTLAQALAPLPVRTGRDAGIDADAKEAVAFAALAWAHALGIAGSVPGVTGARGPRVLGSRTPGRSAAAPAGQIGTDH